MISYSGVSNSKSARGADTITASVPFSAPLTPPLTGLSIELMPREASRSWTSIAACRPTVEKSTKSLDA